jgi:hypothetical protein
VTDEGAGGRAEPLRVRIVLLRQCVRVSAVQKPTP